MAPVINMTDFTLRVHALRQQRQQQLARIACCSSGGVRRLPQIGQCRTRIWREVLLSASPTNVRTTFRDELDSHAT
jgi:hypothetical protein